MKIDVNKLFFFQKKKNIWSVKQKLRFFYLLEKGKCIDVRLYVLNHFPKFQGEIFITVDEKWVKLNYLFGNCLKHQMPLRACNTM